MNNSTSSGAAYDIIRTTEPCKKGGVTSSDDVVLKDHGHAPVKICLVTRSSIGSMEVLAVSEPGMAFNQTTVSLASGESRVKMTRQFAANALASVSSPVLNIYFIYGCVRLCFVCFFACLLAWLVGCLLRRLAMLSVLSTPLCSNMISFALKSRKQTRCSSPR